MPASLADIPCALNKDGVKLRTMIKPTLNKAQTAPAKAHQSFLSPRKAGVRSTFEHGSLSGWAVDRGDQNPDYGGGYSRTQKC